MLLETVWETLASWRTGTVWNGQTAKSPGIVSLGLSGIVEGTESYPVVEATGFRDRSEMVKDNG